MDGRRLPVPVRRGAALGAALALGVVGLLGGGAAEARPSGRADAVVELGRRLFFDPAVSRSGDNSCASCHEPTAAFSSPQRVNADDFSLTRRHSQTLVDAALGKRFHWDGEFDSVADLVSARLSSSSGQRPVRARALVAALAAEAGASGTAAAATASGGSSYGPPPPTTSTPPPPPTPPTTPPTAPPPATPTSGSDDDGDPATTGDDEVAATADGATADGATDDGATDDGATDDAGPTAATTPTIAVAAAVEPDAAPASARPAPTRSTPAAGTDVAARVEADGRYAEAFLAAFGTREVSVARIAEAIAAFVGTIRSGTSAFDRFADGDPTALDAAAQRGLALFRGRAGCAACHAMTGPRAAFTDHGFHNTGIAARTAARRATPAVTTGEAPPAPDAHVLAATLDPGRALMSKALRDTGAFKTPTLRDVAARAPYMHDGSFRTLEGVVRHYARGGFPDPRLDARVRRFEADDRDVADLVAFLRALSSDVAPGLAPDLPARATRTELRFVDARGRPLVGLPVRVEPVGDRLPGDVPVASRAASLTTDDDGRVAYAPARRTHMRLALPAGVTVPQGPWIPDTCRALTLPTSVAGRATLAVAWPAGAPVPAALAAYHEARPLTDAQRDALRAHAPATLAALRTAAPTFTLVGRVEVAGRTVARFEAWLPDACAVKAVVDVPLPARRVTAPVALAPGHETRLDFDR